MLTHFAVYGSTSDKNARTVHFSGPSRGDFRRQKVRPILLGTVGATSEVGNLGNGNTADGPVASSVRFKKEIRPMDKTSEAILALKPVRFQYKSDSKGTPQFGLIAEEVATVNPALVVRDRNGEIYSVRYEAVNAMLLNEFLKAQRRIEEQDAANRRLRACPERSRMGQSPYLHCRRGKPRSPSHGNARRRRATRLSPNGSIVLVRMCAIASSMESVA